MASAWWRCVLAGGCSPRILRVPGVLLQSLLGLAAGWASLPAWTALAAASALALGVPLGAPVPPGATPAAALLLVVAAPLLEELLYRGYLLGALRPRIGGLPALVVTSGLFAAAHGEPRLVVATFLVGAGLGALRLAGASLALPIGLHAGLNLGVMTCGVPPGGPALPTGAGALLAAALTALACAAAPGSGAAPRTWRLRVAALALAALPVASVRALELPPERREAVLWAVLVTMGWGHLLGAALFAWPRIRARLGADVPAGLAGAFCIGLVASLFGAYAWLLSEAPALVLLLLAASAWHTAENELVLGAAWRGGGRAPAFPGGAAAQVPGLAAAAGLALVFWSAGAGQALLPGLAVGASGGPAVAALRLATASAGAWLLLRGPDRRERGLGALLLGAALGLPADLPGGVDFAELFVLLGLHHVLSWGLLLSGRVAATARAVGRRRAVREGAQLAALHAVPALGCALLVALPDPRLDGLRAWVFSPAVYLFASALHVVQTAWLRRA